MPNYCSNRVTFQHEDVEMINKVAESIVVDRLFSTFVTPPESYETEDDWYHWNVENWGTKWEAGCIDIEDKTDSSITLYFDSAWSPPLAFYTAMEEKHNFEVLAYYFEEGMAFCGKYQDGFNEEYSVPKTVAEVEQNIPEDIDEVFGISCLVESYEEDEEDDE